MSALDEHLAEAANWPLDARLKVLAETQRVVWEKLGRPEQRAPEGEWRTWYLMGGRGSGKTRAGAEWIAEQEALHDPGIYAIVAPVFADAVKKCVEETLVPILQGRVSHWNRSLGELYLKSGSQIYCDGADDGADRIQGFNLRGVWADEVGLWAQSKWEQAWFFAIKPAVRLDPGRIVATGTPKMGHPLVRVLVDDEKVPVSHMHTSDNVANLSRETIEDLYSHYPEGSLLRRQELEGEWIAALEGDLLKRSWWRYYDQRPRTETLKSYVARLPKFQWVLVSVDTPLKDKESSDFVAIQVWGVDRANRYLLDARTERMGYDQARRAIIDMSRWARQLWRCQHRVLIENAGYGVELIVDLKRELGLVEKISPGAEGSKGMRALSAAGDLETGNVFLPGKMRSDLSGPDETSSPAITLSLVDEAALFQLDGSHGSHDDQVDAWSQAMNWLRSRKHKPARTYSPYLRRR